MVIAFRIKDHQIIPQLLKGKPPVTSPEPPKKDTEKPKDFYNGDNKILVKNLT